MVVYDSLDALQPLHQFVRMVLQKLIAQVLLEDVFRLGHQLFEVIQLARRSLVQLSQLRKVQIFVNVVAYDEYVFFVLLLFDLLAATAA